MQTRRRAKDNQAWRGCQTDRAGRRGNAYFHARAAQTTADLSNSDRYPRKTQPQRIPTMAKYQDATKKETKKKPEKTLKEKRADKAAKKASK